MDSDLAYSSASLIGSLVFQIGICVALGFLGRKIVRDKGYPDNMNHGFAWCFWLGLIGLIVVALKQPYVDPNLTYNPYNLGQNPQYPTGAPQQYQPQQPYPQQYPWQCPSCGAQNAPDAGFCAHCGARR